MDLNTCLATTEGVRSLAMYSHIVPALASTIMAVIVLERAQDKIKAGYFAGFIFAFSLWLVGDLIVWTFNDYYAVAAAWAPLDYINIVFFLLLFCFVYTDLNRRNLPQILQYVVVGVATAPFLITAAGYGVLEFNQAVCEMASNEFLTYYKVILEWGVLASVAIMGLYHLAQNWTSSTERNRTFLTVGSILLFMGVFSGSEYIASTTEIYEINLYALFSLPVFILTLALSITNYGTFRLGNAAFQVLFYLFLILAGSEFFFVENLTSFAISALTLVVLIAAGLLLLTSAQREAKARKEVEALAKELEAANVRLRELDKLKSEFVSIASHQLRSPLAAIKGYASMLLEGSFGRLSVGAHEAVGRIFSSSALMARSVEDFLNVSRIELGRMKYDLSEFDMCKLVETVIEEQKPLAEDKKLKLKFFKDASITTCDVLADIGKIKQVITNFVDNAIKYTPRGTVTVTFSRDIKRGMTRVGVTDTGIGMSPETIKKLFAKFARADNANKVNVIGTGLGLFVAKQLVEAHGGRVWAESPGDGKGSTFFFEIPFQAKGEAVAAATVDSMKPEEPSK